MNRNTEAHFSKLPNVKIQRSLFDRSTQNKLSFNAGLLIPIFADEYLPGDTFTLDTSIVIRTSSAMIKPVMDNMYADIYYFSVPNRLVWEHWEEFMGENKTSDWVQTTEYTIPQVEAPNGGWNIGTIADYFSIPTGISNISISSLFFRAYALIWNQYFRDENLMNATDVPRTDATEYGVNSGTLETDACKGGLPLPVCKFHDYFTSALPQAQKSPYEITLPLVRGNAQTPVLGNGLTVGIQNGLGLLSGLYIDTDGTLKTATYSTASTDLPGSDIGTEVDTTTTQIPNTAETVGIWVDPLGGSETYSGLWTDLGAVSAATINQLRQAFALQHLFEVDARGGTRYTESIKAHFNVSSPDARLQRPEYLGGKRIPINVSQVVQMSGTESSSGTQQTPQANVAAYSLTGDKASSFTKSFTEHGMIIGLICVRTEHTYQQGINRMFSRTRRFDFYTPELANLGEQEILAKEIYATGQTTDENGWGFQERWAEYRYKPSIVCGQMRSNATGTLDVYHFADNYSQYPYLGQSWIQEVKTNIDRTLAVPSTTTNQFIADIYFNYRCARPMPVYSVPKLIG